MITNTTKEALLAQSTAKIFCSVLRITGTGIEFCFVDNNGSVNISGTVYSPRGFDFSPPDPQSDDGTSTVTIEDVDRDLMYVLQETEDPVSIAIGYIRFDDPSVYIDGPYDYNLENLTSSGDGSLKLELSKQSRLGFSASRIAYTATEFPGLFG
ncbi:hypothetical protein [uncultured Sphaerochaeta sp.]|uniref:hypothetical protein n=1 Tax=uncultured Sphaerochaeta sp. TaxID=886478 RepID=UPI002A0A9001|nr:hypothetical protein [uncultured Sphaerochaeta sp.]